MKVKQIVSLVGLFVMLISSSYGQQIIWTGNAANNDFFDESNWEDTNTNMPPSAGAINPNQAINFNLQLNNVSVLVTASGIINLGSGSLSITDANLEAAAFSGGNVTINNLAYVDLTDASPLQNSVTVNFTSGVAWVRVLDKKPLNVLNDDIGKFTVNSVTGVYVNNLRIDNYYENGAVVRSNDAATQPLQIYDNTNLQGDNASLTVDVVHGFWTIPNNMYDKTESFILRKGFMVTFSVTDDGTGPSKNYIASEEDLVVNELPSYLLNDISFIRVIPWNWVAKKGRAGTTTNTDLNNTWNYRWGNNGNSTIEIQVDPMAWGAGGANDDGDIDLYRGKYKATHVMGFNESDDCNGQSGQWSNLCQPEVAVGYYKNLMKTGMRLVSPNCRENAPFGWLKEFRDIANEQDVRIDVIGVHWYDWGSSPQNSPNANPQDVFNRFKNYLQRVYDLYQLPIWITEFNANPNRSTATNLGFMELALPYLESLDYVERYAWFQPSSGTADYFGNPADPNTITDVGIFYRDQVSTPSVPEAAVTDDSTLDIYYALQDLNENNLLVNGFFETGDLTGWSGRNSGVINSGAYEGNSSARIIAGTGTLLQTVDVDSQGQYDLSLYTKWDSAPSSPINIQILNGATEALITSFELPTSTAWTLSEMSFTVPSGITSIIVFIQKSGGSPQLLIDNAVLTKTGSLSVKEVVQKSIYIYPNPTSGSFTLKGDSTIDSYSVFDIQGRMIMEKTMIMQKETQINLNNQKKGVFFIKIKDHSGSQTSKKLILK